MSAFPLRVVCVRPGVYPVGSDRVPDARPQHRRRIDKPFWIEAEPTPADAFVDFVRRVGLPRGTSADDRCEAVRAASVDAFVGGLSWHEARDLAAHAGARLAYESEWEIAAAARPGDVRVVPGLLEWTLDAFSPVYWRADFARRGVPRTGPTQPAVARGWLAEDLVRDVRVRRGLDAALPQCGLRRAWDGLPPDAVVL